MKLGATRRRRTIAGRTVLVLATLFFGAWSAFALFYQGGGGVAAAGWATLLVLLLAAALRRGRAGLVPLALVAAGFLGWWWTLQPRLDRDWASDVARIVTGTLEGDRATLEGVRDFDWRSESEFAPRWKRETYDLSQLAGADVILSYWGMEAIAHTLVSFGFSDGRRVVFSVEIRRERTESFSSLAGFFKTYELALVAAEERDILFLRTNIRNEDTYLYPLRLPPDALRALFLSYVETGNELSREARFYNTLTANCTTVVFKLARLIEPGIPMDWRILLSGYLPGYLLEQHVLAWDVPEAEARRRAAVSARARAAPATVPFSQAIRAAPDPDASRGDPP